jgi:hypothetical protein
MAAGQKTGGRTAGTPNKATAEVRALAGQHGPAAIAELPRLTREAESEQARISACNAICDRAYGRSPIGRPITIKLPDTSTPEGVVKAVAAIVQAISTGEITTNEASDLVAVIEAQRKAIELNDHEQRLKQLEAALVK